MRKRPLPHLARLLVAGGLLVVAAACTDTTFVAPTPLVECSDTTSIVTQVSRKVDVYNTDFDRTSSDATPNLNRSMGRAAACEGPVDPLTGATIVGEPQVRLHQLIGHFGGGEYSVCDVAHYPDVLGDVARHITSHIGHGCLPPLASYGDGTGATPSDQCQVGDGTQAMAECSARCCGALASDASGSMTDAPVESACGAERATPCWCAVRNPSACPSSAEPTLVGVYRGTLFSPAGGAMTQFSCTVSHCG